MPSAFGSVSMADDCCTLGEEWAEIYRYSGGTLEPRDHSVEGELAIEASWS